MEMNTIIDLVGVDRKAGLIGIEIEVEGENLPNADNIKDTGFFDTWLITQDGSLRGEAWEYVFRQPLSYKDTGEALEMLEAQYKSHNSVVHDSIRAGIHVHVNIQDLTVKQLYTMFTIYYCLENILVNWCGEDRVGNHFCLRSCDAEYILFALHHAFAEGGRAGELASDSIRYASMNVASIFKYGSLEFRSLRSTRDWTRLLNWVQALIHIKEAATRFSDPKSVIESISINGPVVFARNVLQDKFQIFETNNLEELVYSALRNVQALAFNLDVKAAEHIVPRKDLNPRYSNSSSTLAHVDWKSKLDKKGAGELPLEEALPPQTPLPKLEVAQQGDRPFEADGDERGEWFGRINAPRLLENTQWNWAQWILNPNLPRDVLHNWQPAPQRLDQLWVEEAQAIDEIADHPNRAPQLHQTVVPDAQGQ